MNELTTEKIQGFINDKLEALRNQQEYSKRQADERYEQCLQSILRNLDNGWFSISAGQPYRIAVTISGSPTEPDGIRLSEGLSEYGIAKFIEARMTTKYNIGTSMQAGGTWEMIFGTKGYTWPEMKVDEEAFLRS